MFQYTAARYFVSGVTAAIVHLSLLYLFTEFFGLWYILSTSFALVFSFWTSFTLQKFWTFKNRRTDIIRTQIFTYLIIVTVFFFLNASLLYLLVDILGLWYILAQVFVLGFVAFASFILYGSMVFNLRKRQTTQGSDPYSYRSRVLIATPLYPPQIGGPATYAKILRDELPHHNLDVDIASFGDAIRLPKFIRHFVYFFDLLQKSTKADVIFALDPVSVGFPSSCVALLMRKKLVLKIVGDYAWEQHQQRLQIANCKLQISLEEFQDGKYDFLTEARRMVQKWVSDRAERIIVPSKYLKEIVGQWGIGQGKIEVVYNAFESVVPKESKEALRRKFDLEGTILISAGRLVPWKGFDTLVETMPEVVKEIPDAKLIIVGDGPQQKNLESRILNLGLGNKVMLTGKIPHDELLQYLKAADLFVLNTGYEGFSHLLLEVMNTGTPIITTRVGGNPELIEDRKSGALIEYNNKKETKDTILVFLRTLESPERQEMVEQARRRAQEFSKERMLVETIKILNSIR